MTSRTLAQLPNAISAARIAAAPLLLALAWRRDEAPYAVVLILALLSDILDGWIARRWQLHSALGATLDSIADLLTLASASAGIAVFHPEVFAQHASGCWLILGGWLIVCAVALLRYRRLSSFHTYASKAAGYALGFFIAALFVFGFHAGLFWLAVVSSVLASIEELVLLWMLPAWRADVRGAWWVWRESAAPIR